MYDLKELYEMFSLNETQIRIMQATIDHLIKKAQLEVLEKALLKPYASRLDSNVRQMILDLKSDS